MPKDLVLPYTYTAEQKFIDTRHKTDDKAKKKENEVACKMICDDFVCFQLNTCFFIAKIIFLRELNICHWDLLRFIDVEKGA